MIIDSCQPDANFVSARHLDVGAEADRVWQVLPQLPVVLRESRWAPVAALPLWVASVLRGDRGRGDNDFGRRPWTLREGVALASALHVGRVDEGTEVVLLGQHRFANYATNFYVESLGPRRSRLHNVTRARFKTDGLGRLYLSGVRVFHNLYIDWMLRRLRRLAEAAV